MTSAPSEKKRRGPDVWVFGAICVVLLSVQSFVAPVFAAGEGEEATAVIRQVTDEVIAVLENKVLPADEKRTKIEGIVVNYFDFKTLGRLTMARNWQKLTPDQQANFVEEFRRHLSLTYGRNVESYHDEKVVITGNRAEARGDWMVKTKIARTNAEDILVDYRLRKENNGWRIIDVVIEGVSLVANFRSQFQDVISRHGAASVIDLLREKNAKGEPLKS